MRPIVLTIAGSDSSAGAGIQADLKAIEACGGYAATVITAITAQSTRGVERVVPLAADVVRDQLSALFADLRFAAAKSGMLGSAEVARTLAEQLRHRPSLPYVLDPVLRASDGSVLLEEAGLAVLRDELLPRATVVTPNATEAESLSGVPVRSLQDAERAGERILASGAQAVLVCGGHLADAPGTDLLVTDAGALPITGAFVDASHTHGTGCVHSAALATALARGASLSEAARSARRFVEEAIRHGLELGAGRGPTDPLFRIHQAAPVTGGGPCR